MLKARIILLYFLKRNSLNPPPFYYIELYSIYIKVIFINIVYCAMLRSRHKPEYNILNEVVIKKATYT